jgi:hypothetical protein
MKSLKIFFVAIANVLFLNAYSQQVACTMVTSNVFCNGTAALYHLNVDPATIVWHGMGIVPKIYTQYGDFNRSNLCVGAYTVTYKTYDGEPMVVSFEITNGINWQPCHGIGVGLNIYTPTLSDCSGDMSAVQFSSQCGNFNGNPPFSYVWSNGSTSDHITNFCPGKYYVVQTDSLGCAASMSAVIHEGFGYYNDVEELTNNEKTIVKITDILGRECEMDAGELRIVLYSDGTMKKVIAN